VRAAIFAFYLAAMASLPDAGGHIQVARGRGDVPSATLAHPSGAVCEVALCGAHITSWRTHDGVERLFMSSASAFAPGSAIRGGIPVCFPQFSGRGSLPKHGFARTSSEWQIEAMSTEDDVCRLVLVLTDSDATRAHWPHSFTLRYTIILASDGLTTEFELHNTDEAPLAFTCALHTYFAVADVRDVRAVGLQGLTYEDNAAGGERSTEASEQVAIAGEVDRVYLDAHETATLRGVRGHESIVINKRGFRDLVLWNLGEAKAPSMADLGAGEWRNYICLEAGSIGEPVTLAPGTSFCGLQSFAVQADDERS